MKLIFKWLLSALALLGVASIYSGVQIQGFGAALLAALVIGLFNMVLRPTCWTVFRCAALGRLCWAR